MELDMPITALDSVDGSLETLPHGSRVRFTRRSAADDSANSAAMHLVEFRVGSVVGNHGDATRASAQLPDRIQSAGVICAVEARLDDNNALRMYRPVHRAHLRYRGAFRCVSSGCNKRKLARVSNDACVAVARTRWHIEAYRCLGLCGATKSSCEGPGERANTGYPCAFKNISSRKHRSSIKFGLLHDAQPAQAPFLI